jgi:hypothetical protein
MPHYRRPSGLMRQLDWLWETVEELKDETDEPTAPDGSPIADPGDITVYFENGLTGA